MPAPTVGVTIPKPNPAWERWHDQFRNDAAKGPNLARSIGRLVAGLLQQAPVAFDDSVDPDTAVLTTGQLADLTDRAVKRATAEAVVFLRPAQVNHRWVVGVLHGGQVEAVWEHDQLVEATAWRVIDPTAEAPLMVTEHYTDTDEADVRLWRVKKSPAGDNRWELETELDYRTDLEGVETPDLYRQLRDQKPRRLFPYVFDFEDGAPIPIHFTNEHLIDALNDLAEIEKEDNALPRNILAVNAESLRASKAAFDGGQLLGRVRGFIQGKNMLAVPGDQLAQHGTDGFVKQIRLDDDLIQRERIEQKQNEFYEACGISPGTLGREISGRSDSAAAKRADSANTLVTIAGPARRWAATLTDLAAELARLAAESSSDRTAAGPVSVTEGLKMSAEERAELVGTQRDADVQSIRSGVQQIHPDWDDEAVDAEVALIRNDNGIITPPDDDVD